MYRFIKYVIYTLVGLYAFLNFFLYAVYKYKLSSIDVKKITQQKFQNYQEFFYTSYWATFSNTSEMQMKAFYTSDFPFALYKTLTAKSIDSSYRNSSLTLSNYVVRTVECYDKKGNKIRGNKHLLRSMYAVWISHNLTAKEAMNLLFSKMYYANSYYSLAEASKGYFHKNPNDLDIYELLMLHLMTVSPSALNPRKHPNHLLSRLNRLIKRIEKNSLLKDKEVVEQKELPNFF